MKEKGLALIRKCNKCQKVTAVDLEPTLKTKRKMEMLGQTIYEVTREEAVKQWNTDGGRCECGQQRLEGVA